MEDTIEVCSGCGKMPRPIDQGAGSFVCSRCGNRTTIQVTTENYEKVVLELDRRFHESIMSRKAASVSREPIVAKAKKKPVKAPAVKAKNR
jgi:DNA-directed RNA polymerase subunit RPC12/RpoP